MDFRRATAPERSQVDALLAAAGQPPLPLRVPLSNLLVALDEGRVVGAVAVAVVARQGLLVSLVTEAGAARAETVASLLQSLLSRANEIGLHEVYATVEDPEALLADLGFAEIDPQEVPQAIRKLDGYREAPGPPLRLAVTSRW